MRIPLGYFAIEVGDGSFVRGEGVNCGLDTFLSAIGDVTAVGLFDSFLDLEFLFCGWFGSGGFVFVVVGGGWFAKTGIELCCCVTMTTWWVQIQGTRRRLQEEKRDQN